MFLKGSRQNNNVWCVLSSHVYKYKLVQFVFISNVQRSRLESIMNYLQFILCAEDNIPLRLSKNLLQEILVVHEELLLIKTNKHSKFYLTTCELNLYNFNS